MSGPDVTRIVLTQLIDRSLMLAEVERYAPPEPSVPAVDRELADGAGALFVAGGVSRGSDPVRRRRNRRCARRCARTCGCVPTSSSGSPPCRPSDEEVAEYFRAHADDSRVAAAPALDDVRDDVIQALGLDRRQTMVDDWMAGLRRRAAMSDVYASRRPDARDYSCR